MEQTVCIPALAVVQHCRISRTATGKLGEQLGFLKILIVIFKPHLHPSPTLLDTRMETWQWVDATAGYSPAGCLLDIALRAGDVSPRSLRAKGMPSWCGPGLGTC